ncbi:MAG: peptidylprolyl isomerase [Firmicutes bacterium]|nr:peptidylprolyl isomerase [Bacillota bacterium]
MKKNLFVLLLSIILVLCFNVTTYAADSVTALPTSSTVLVNGNKVAFDSYNIKGNNYFKLRDLAFILSKTAKQFEVTFDNESNTISLTGAKPYTVVGGEMKGKGQGDKEAFSTTSKIYFNDKDLHFIVYNIEGNNYFKLRDIAAALDFGVDWDAAKNTIVIDTSKVYSPAMPPNTNTPSWNEIIGSVNGINVYSYEYNYYLNKFYEEYINNYYESILLYQGVDMFDEESSREFLCDLEEHAWNATIQATLIRQIAAKEYYINLDANYYESLLLPDAALSINTNRLYGLIYPYIEEEAIASKSISDAEMKEYYEYDPSVWDCRKVAHIIITAQQILDEAIEKGQDITEDKALEAAKKRAEDIIARLAKGEDYVKLAAEFSADGTAESGGVMDIYFNIYGDFIGEDGGGFDPLFAEGAFLLKNVGDTSKTPVESSFGYHIIKLLDKREGFEAAKDAISNSKMEVDSAYISEYFANKLQNLQDTATIVRNFEFKYYEETPRL